MPISRTLVKMIWELNDKGKSCREIADELRIGKSTVDKYLGEPRPANDEGAA